jgi:PAS domain-containing protein
MDVIFAGVAVFAVACACLMITMRLRQTPDAPASTEAEIREPLILVFHEDRLIDADDRIWSVLPDQSAHNTWAVVRAVLVAALPDLPEIPAETDGGSTDVGILFSITKRGTGFRLVLRPVPGAQIDWFQARQALVTSRQMFEAMTHAPDLMWHQGTGNTVLWGNDAFVRHAKTHRDPSRFADHLSELLRNTDPSRPARIELSASGHHPDQDKWLEVTRRDASTGRFFFARGIDDMVRAEAAQRNFVQTLTKTFANLTTGLAIFDRDRRLMLFNPALVDLSRVSIDFLSARPALFEFFDKLRDCRIMPEPKNYDDWRERMARLVAAATDDRFRETWTLASGQILDITGQPYPDGAIAFLFNDITAEVSLTRGYRAELDTLQSVIDMIEDAVAVFDPKGILTVCNMAYADLWNVDPDSCIPETTIVDATLSWKAAFHPTPLWPDLRDFVTSTTERVSWDSELRGKDGREVLCRVDPICQGATLIRFCIRPRLRDSQPDKEGLQIVSA